MLDSAEKTYGDLYSLCLARALLYNWWVITHNWFTCDQNTQKS